MSDYTPITDFSAKDALTTGDPNKLIQGSHIDAELAAIATAVASKKETVVESDVTAHQAALSIAETQIPDGAVLARVGANETITGNWSFSGTATHTGNFTLTSVSPSMFLTETGVTANNTVWRIIVDGEAFFMQTMNDAASTAVSFMTVQRTANTCDSITFAGTTIAITGNETVSGTLAVTGAATLSSTLAVTSNATIGGTLGVTGASTFSGLASFSNAQYAGIEIGWRTVPASATTSGSLTVAEVGKCVPATAGVTIPNATFSAGDCLSIYNNSASAITITAGITTMRLAGSTTTGSRNLAARGMATIWFLSSTECIVSGPGVS
jgi:hypothetical protein